MRCMGTAALILMLGLTACAAPDLNNSCDPSDTEFAFNQFFCLPDGVSAFADAAAGGAGGDGTGANGTAPTISVTLNGVAQTAGGNVPMGNVSTGGSEYTVIFTITNTGGGVLNLPDTPTIALSGDTTNYSILAQPSLTALSSGQSTTFSVTYRPGTAVVHTAAATIVSDDATQGSFQLNFSGTGQTGFFVAVGNTCDIRRNTDPSGGGWSNGTTPGGCTETMFSVAHGNDGASGKFVAVGDGGRIITSTDRGVNWTLATSNTVNNLRGVAHGNGTWVAVGANNTIQYTTDPAGSWQSATSITGNFETVAYGNGTWIAAGNVGNICTSTDAANWSCSIPNGAINWNGLAFGDGAFVLAGASGAVFSTTNGGTSWFNKTTLGEGYQKVGFGANRFGIVAQKFGGAPAVFIHDLATAMAGAGALGGQQDLVGWGGANFFGGEIAFGNNIWVTVSSGTNGDLVFYNTNTNLGGAWVQNAVGINGAWRGLSFED